MPEDAFESDHGELILNYSLALTIHDGVSILEGEARKMLDDDELINPLRREAEATIENAEIIKAKIEQEFKFNVTE
jgi:hypothetical protein